MKEIFKRFTAFLKRKHNWFYFLSVGLMVILLVLDIVTKNIAYNCLKPGDSVVAIPYLFNFTLVFNDGAAWGMLAGQEWFLCLISAVLGTGILVYLLYRFRKLSLPWIIGLSMMVAGAYGNLIDRIGQAGDLGIYANGVIDFLQFAFWTSFPVFNLADSYLVIGIVILLVTLIVEIIRDHMKKEKEPTISETSQEDLIKKLTQQDDKDE